MISLLSAGAGLIGWLLALGLLELNPLQQLFLLGPLVLVPLGLRLSLSPLRSGKLSVLYQLLICCQPAAALCLGLSFSQPPGPLAALLSFPWLVLTAGCALAGVLRHLPHGFTDAGEVCLDACLVFLSVGGVWLLASRLGRPLMGFNEPLVLLTAMHFHFAGFCAALLTGLSGRLNLSRGLYRMVCTGVLAGIPLLALGIAFAPLLEVASAAIFALSLVSLALLWLTQWPRLNQNSRQKQARLLLLIAGLSVLLSMGFALSFALSEFLGLGWVSIPEMVRWHGALNALGFALPGLLAFSLLQLESRLPPAGIPFSRLRGSLKIGPDFFERLGAVPEFISNPPQGLIDQMLSFERVDFESAALDPAVRDFYEQTANYRLYVSPFWQRGFVKAGRFWRRLMEPIGQLCLPTESEAKQEAIQSRILALDPAIDGRPGVRAWVRTYQRSQKAVYVAAYASHRWQGQVYMNIAFALPAGHMTSILKLDHLELTEPLGHKKALRLSTLASAPDKSVLQGDQGVYLILFGLVIRLPINETISVWSRGTPGLPDLGQGSEMEDAPLLALHQMWIGGIHFLTLHYFIYPCFMPESSA